MAKISVIVPIYNIGPYLKQCIESIQNQTLSDIEIVLVDDGSTDGGSIVCDEFASKDDRIKVIHKTNEGLSAARNDGIEASTAPYIMFVDGDDWVEPKFCEIPYIAAMKNNADLVLFTYNKHYNSGEKDTVDTKTAVGILKESEALYFNAHGFHSVWLGLYSRKLFDIVRFPKGKFYEDVATSHKFIHVAKTIYYIDLPLYNYRVGRPGSISTNPETMHHMDGDEMILTRIKDFYDWGYGKLIERDAFHELIIHGDSNHEYGYLTKIVKGINGQIPDNFSWKQRILLTVYKISPTLFDVLCNVTCKRKND